MLPNQPAFHVSISVKIYPTAFATQEQNVIVSNIANQIQQCLEPLTSRSVDPGFVQRQSPELIYDLSEISIDQSAASNSLITADEVLPSTEILAKDETTVTDSPSTATSVVTIPPNENIITTSKCDDSIGMYDCIHPGCTYSSDRQFNLVRHTKKLHTQLEEPTICCKSTFNTKFDKNVHVETVHGSGFSCDFEGCDMKFPKKATLDRHNKVHSGEKEIKCDTCNYATPFTYNMERHCNKKKHVCLNEKMRRFKEKLEQGNTLVETRKRSMTSNSDSEPEKKKTRRDVSISRETETKKTRSSTKQSLSIISSEERASLLNAKYDINDVVLARKIKILNQIGLFYTPSNGLILN